MPSATSTMMTWRASSFSATRCAVVAPTLPAPTTVILRNMRVSSVIGLWRVSLRFARKSSRLHRRSQLQEIEVQSEADLIPDCRCLEDRPTVREAKTAAAGFVTAAPHNERLRECAGFLFERIHRARCAADDLSLAAPPLAPEQRAEPPLAAGLWRSSHRCGDPPDVHR